MLSLQEIQDHYANNLENKIFRYILQGGQIIDLRFYQQSFCHLLGIQHIMHQNRDYIGLRGYQKIQRGELTLSSLRKRDAKQYRQMSRRIQGLTKICEMLLRGKMYRFYLMRQPHTRVNADFVLYWRDEVDLYHNLFMAKEKSLFSKRQMDHAYSAISYIVMTEKDDHDMYIERQEFKRIINFEILPVASK